MENGGDITIGQRMAGHANIKTTQCTTGAMMT
jgi:site-specific recombinase XerD